MYWKVGSNWKMIQQQKSTQNTIRTNASRKIRAKISFNVGSSFSEKKLTITTTTLCTMWIKSVDLVVLIAVGERLFGNHVGAIAFNSYIKFIKRQQKNKQIHFYKCVELLDVSQSVSALEMHDERTYSERHIQRTLFISKMQRPMMIACNDDKFNSIRCYSSL